MRRSLRLLVAATTSAIALSLLIPLGLLVGTLATDRAVQAASEEAAALAAVVATLPAGADAGPVVEAADQRSALVLAVRLPDGQVVGSSAGAEDRDRVAADFARAAAGESFTTTASGSSVIYVPAVTATGTAVVRVEVPPTEMSRGVSSARAVLALLGLGMLVVATVVADAAARRISAPLVAIAATARRHRAGELDIRAPETGPPEVVDVGRALNDLADRVEELLVAEREAVADLAHRLRTPMTALRLAGEQVAEPVGDRVRGYVDDLERAVDGVVRDARRPVRATMTAHCDAAVVAADRAAFWTPLAEDREVHLTVAPHGRAAVPVDPQDLSDALDALLDNAFTHGGDLHRVHVAVTTEAEVVVVSVEDDGRGLPAEHAVSRGASGSGSTGLGLDIAARTAAAAGGSLVTGASDLGGAKVALRLPARTR